MSKEVKKRKPGEISSQDSTGLKKTKVTAEPPLPKLEINKKLQDAEFVTKLRANWGKSSETSEKEIVVEVQPFPHVEIEDILVDASVLKSLQTTMTYSERSTDLFHFHQSCDLSSVFEDFDGYRDVKQLSNFFKTDLFDAVKTITDLPLSGKFDIFASEYKLTDHLLCHDDELDSRRIAFIIYMNEDWKPDFGGTLDLFDSIDGENGPSPGKVVKSIVPKFNKLVFFEVTAKSFHQVGEVVHETACRRAVSGWYYGDPLPRPEVHLPMETFHSVDFPECTEAKLDSFLGTSYLDQETLKTANDQLSENSEILLSSFLKPDVYEAVLGKLEAMNASQWQECGPANLRNYRQLPETVPGFPIELKEFFTSKNFLEFLQDLTEFPFASEPELRFSYSLKKFQRGSYTLVRGKERTYKPRNFVPLDSADENSDFDDTAEEQQEATGDENASPGSDNPQHSRTGNGVHDSENEDVIVLDDSPEGYEIVEDEDPEEPNRVDVVFYLIPQIKSEANGTTVNGSSDDGSAANHPSGSGKWDESWGGNRIYTDDLTGNQLINLVPSGNSLAVVVRDESISSHYSYVSSLAKNSVFYCYDFEFDFPRTK